MTNEIIKMPRALKHFLFLTTGISGIAYMHNGNLEVGFGFSVTLFISGVLSSLATYGLISLIADFKEGKSWKGMLKVLIKKIKYITNDTIN
tara:strand:+ start:201 stop:473 length:273 start_codon:yes stop_codon:yes gene_type:complete